MTLLRRRWFWLALALGLAGLGDFLLGNGFAALAFLPILGAVGGLLGGGGGGGLGGGTAAPTNSTVGDFNFGGSGKESETKRQTLYIVGALAALALVIGAAWLIRRKK